MATDQEVSASTEAVTTDVPQTPEIDEAVLKTHPAYKALEEAKNAADQELKTMKGRLKSETSKKSEPKDDTTSKASLDEEEVDFRIQHNDELKVYGATYKELRSKGYDRSDALELAKLRHQKSTTQSAEVQAANSSPTPVAARSISSDVITEQDQQDMQTWGFSKETLLAHKKLKQQRGGK